MALNRKPQNVRIVLKPSIAILVFLMIPCASQETPGDPQIDHGLSFDGTTSKTALSAQLQLKSRRKQQTLNFKSFQFRSGTGTIPGIQSARQEPLNIPGGYGDGQNCETGQEPWNQVEANIVKKSVHDTDEGYFRLFYRTAPELGLTVTEKCKSRKCYFDGRTWTLTCGPAPKFKDGETCTIGAEPLSESEAAKDPLKQEYDQQSSTKRRFNYRKARDVQVMYGANCESGSCYFSWDKMSAICGSPSSYLTTLVFMSFATLLGLSVFLMLPDNYSIC